LTLLTKVYIIVKIISKSVGCIMIRIDVSDIRRQPGLSKTFEYDDEFDMTEVDLKCPISARLKLTNAHSRIIVEGFIKILMILECVRCLEIYEFTHELKLCEEFLPHDSSEIHGKEKLSWEDHSYFTFSNDLIDIYEMIRQNILTAIPVKPLCGEDCRGICPHCGNNRNHEICSCEEEAVDLRLLPLLKFKSNDG